MLFGQKDMVFLAKTGSSKGVALIIVLWIVVILSAIALEFSYSMRIETDLTGNFINGQKAYFGARAGIERAVKEILRSQRAVTVLKDTEKEPLWHLMGKPNHFTMDDTEITVTIEPENARININSLSKESLKEILLGVGLTEERANSVIDCFFDWQDGDNLHRMMGAEKDYYQKLDPPYQPANSNIEVLEELLMIKGIDKRLFYGDKALPTLADFISEKEDEETEFHIREGLSSIFTIFSVYGNRRSKIGLNSAPRAVLMSLPLMDEEAAQAIIDARKQEPITTIADLVNLIGLPLYKGIEKYITLRDGIHRYYTITSTAFSGGERVSHSIMTVVDILPRMPRMPRMPRRNKKDTPFSFIRWEDCKI